MNIGAMMKQAQAMQTKMAEMQEKIGELEATGQSGGGMVNVTLSGKHEMRGIEIDKSIVDPEDTDMLADLIAAAYNDAKRKIEEEIESETQKVMGDLKLPAGMKLPF